MLQLVQGQCKIAVRRRKYCPEFLKFEKRLNIMDNHSIQDIRSFSGDLPGFSELDFFT